jgi:Multiubiquitin
MPEKPKKTVTIIVNQDDHEAFKAKISYDEVVAFYLQDGGTASTEYLIKYSRGHSANISGTLAPGQEVMVKDGMRFRVSGTGES